MLNKCLKKPQRNLLIKIVLRIKWIRNVSNLLILSSLENRRGGPVITCFVNPFRKLGREIFNAAQPRIFRLLLVFTDEIWCRSPQRNKQPLIQKLFLQISLAFVTRPKRRDFKRCDNFFTPNLCAQNSGTSKKCPNKSSYFACVTKHGIISHFLISLKRYPKRDAKP